MISRDTKLLLWLSYGTDGDDTLFYEILSGFGDLEEAYEAAESGDMTPFGDIPETVQSRLRQAAGKGFLDRYCAWIEKNGIRLLTPYDDSYPVSLEKEKDPPPLLFMLGTMPDPRAAAFAAAAERIGFIPEDTCPIAVLPCGIDRVQSVLPDEIRKEVLKKGCVITPYLPKTERTEETGKNAERIASALTRHSGAEFETEDCSKMPGRDAGEKRIPFSALSEPQQRVYMAVRIAEPEIGSLPKLTGLGEEEADCAARELIALQAVKSRQGKLLLNESRCEITFDR